MMQVVICEDDALYRQSLQESMAKWGRDTGHMDIEVHAFHSSEDLLESWSAGMNIHILFLDIQIPNEMSGMEVARIIRKADADVPIVFVTNYDEYVYQGYTFSALRYLKKPVDEHEVSACLEIAYRHYSLLHQERAVLSVPGERISLRYAEILYIEAHSPNLAIVTINLNQPISIRYRLSSILELLPESLFTPCHRSYIVNISHIRILRKTNLLLSDNTELPVSEKHVKLLFDRFNQYHQRGR